MALLEILSYIVTVVGILLCVFFVIFIFAGKRLAGDKGGPQIIKYKGLELQTSSIITMLLVSVAVTVLPLILLFYLESKKPAATISPEAYEIFMVGRIEDESGRPLEGARATVTEIKPDGKMQRLKEETVETDGNFNFAVRVGAGDKLKLETHKEGYRKQTIILQLKGVNFPSVLVKKKGGE